MLSTVNHPPNMSDTLQGGLSRAPRCSESHRTCTFSILQAIQSLCIPPSACLSIGDDSFSPQLEHANATSTHARKMDDALTINRNVTELVAQVLSCSCSEISSVQLLLVIVCDRLVAWYQAIANSPRYGESTALQGHFPMSTHTTYEEEGQSERVLAQPVKIGEFAMDPDLQMRIQDQLVLGELHRMETTIQQFAARVQETKNRTPSAQGQKIFEILNGLLRDQLQTQISITRKRLENR